MGRILSIAEKRVVSSFLRDTIDGIYVISSRNSAEQNIDLISFVIHERVRDLHLQFCIYVDSFFFFFLRIYFPEDVASEIFQRLISQGIALLIQDRGMLHSLLKLFECDSLVS